MHTKKAIEGYPPKKSAGGFGDHCDVRPLAGTSPHFSPANPASRNLRGLFAVDSL